MSHHRAQRRLVAKLIATWVGVLTIACSTASAGQITSEGPLSTITTGTDLSCQVQLNGDGHGEFFAGIPGSCGTHVGVGAAGSTGGPVFGYAGNDHLTAVEQGPVTGSGTAGSPYKLVTTVAAGGTGVEIDQTDTYVRGQARYETAAAVTNRSSNAVAIMLYHAADCYLGDSDYGYGYYDAATGGIFCTKNASNSPAGRLEGFVPVDGDSTYLETGFSSNYEAVRAGGPLPNRCLCDSRVDNGMSIAWKFELGPGQTATRRWITTFSHSGEISANSLVALGDSVSAGEGIGYGWTWDNAARRWTNGLSIPWLTDSEPEACHQTAFGHPRLLARSLGAQLTHLSCTGSTTYNGVLRAKKNGETQVAPAQLGGGAGPGAEPANARYDNASPDLVTLSLGANDVNFSGIVTRCYGPDLVGAGQCGLSGDDDRNVTYSIAIAKASVRKVLEEIVARGRAAGKVPVVAMTQYVDPFPATYPSRGDCIDVNIAGHAGGDTPSGVQISSFEMSWLRAKLRELNSALAAVGGEFPNVVVVPPPASFDRHRWCSSDPWVYGASLKVYDPSTQAPFHPTPAGQAAISQQIVDRLSASRHVVGGAVVPVTFSNGARLLFDRVATAGTAFLSRLGSSGSAVAAGQPVRGAADSATVASIPGSEFPAPSDFAPVAFYSVGTSAEFEGSVEVELPADGATALYQLQGGRWVRLETTAEGDDLVAEVTVLAPLAVGDPVAPVAARFSVSDGARTAPATVAVDGSASTVDGAGVARYEWDFGDDTTADGVTASHVYATSGTYTIRLTATSAAGASAQVERDITITNPAPVTRLAVPSDLAPNSEGTFDASASSDPNGSVTTVLWRFGDGSDPQIGSVVTHRYPAEGTYELTAVAADDEGEETTATAQIRVATARPTPSPAPTQSPTPPPTLPASPTPSPSPTVPPETPQVTPPSVAPVLPLAEPLAAPRPGSLVIVNGLPRNVAATIDGASTAVSVKKNATGTPSLSTAATHQVSITQTKGGRRILKSPVTVRTFAVESDGLTALIIRGRPEHPVFQVVTATAASRKLVNLLRDIRRVRFAATSKSKPFAASTAQVISVPKSNANWIVPDFSTRLRMPTDAFLAILRPKSGRHVGLEIR